MITTAYRPATSRAVKPLLARGRRRRPSRFALAARSAAAMNPGYILGMAAGAMLATAAILASAIA